MRLEPHTPAYEQWIADNLGSDFDEADVFDLLNDETETCIICGCRFTSKHDFEPDAYEIDGDRVCLECDAMGEHDPVDPVREWGTL